MRKVLLVVGGVALMAGSLQVPVTANAAEEACEWVGTVEVANTSSFPTMYGNADTRTIQTVTARNTATGCEVTRALSYRDAFDPTTGQADCGVKSFTRTEAEATTSGTLTAALGTYTDSYYGPPTTYDVINVGLTAPAVQATVYTDQVDTCTGTVISSTETGTAEVGSLKRSTNKCSLGNVPPQLLKAPGPNAQAVTTGCSLGDPRGASFAMDVKLQRSTCDPTVDSDGGGEGDCAEFAAGRNPGDPADDVVPEVDLPPVAVADRAKTSRFSKVTIDVLANDSDPEGAALTLQSCTKPTFGTVSVKGGRAEYTPWRSSWGTATFSCTIADPAGQQATAPVTVTVTKRR